MIARFLTGLCRTDLYSLQIYITLIALAAFIIPTLIITVCYCFIIAVICRNDDDAQRERTNWTFERQESLLSNGMSSKFFHSRLHVRIWNFFQMEWRGRNNIFGNSYLLILLCEFNKFEVRTPPHLAKSVYVCKGLRDTVYHLSITLLHFLSATVDSSRGYPLGRHRNPIIERAKVRTVKMTFFIVLGKLIL